MKPIIEGAIASGSVYKIPITWEELCKCTGLPGYSPHPGGTPAWAMKEDYLKGIASGDDSMELLPDGSGVYMILDNSDNLWTPERNKTGSAPIERRPKKEPERLRAPSPGLRFKVFHRDGFACVYCGRKAPDVELSPDHVIPYAKGGLTVLENLVTACRPCNAGKAAKQL